MLKVIAEDSIRPEYTETALPLYRELITATKEESHYIIYDLYTNEKGPGHFVFIEERPDHTAPDEHYAGEHFQRLVPLIDQYARQEVCYTPVNDMVNPTVL